MDILAACEMRLDYAKQGIAEYWISRLAVLWMLWITGESRMIKEKNRVNKSGYIETSILRG